MEIGILGASGRVGKCLMQQILASADDRLVGAYVSVGSQLLGRRIKSSDLKYQLIDASLESPADLIIDFSTPVATMTILDDLSMRTKALVIGTTGFTPEQEYRINEASVLSPIMVGANFAQSFEAFVTTCRTLAAFYPDEIPRLEETYHEHKKAVPSGTSLRLASELKEARKLAGCTSDSDIPIKVNRKGKVTGKHSCCIDLGDYEIVIGFSVDGLEPYARGALTAGHWLISQPNGLYKPADMLKKKS